MLHGVVATLSSVAVAMAVCCYMLVVQVALNHCVKCFAACSMDGRNNSRSRCLLVPLAKMSKNCVLSTVNKKSLIKRYGDVNMVVRFISVNSFSFYIMLLFLLQYLLPYCLAYNCAKYWIRNKTAVLLTETLQHTTCKRG